jgi:hypothetical protein
MPRHLVSAVLAAHTALWLAMPASALVEFLQWRERRRRAGAAVPAGTT